MSFIIRVKYWLLAAFTSKESVNLEYVFCAEEKSLFALSAIDSMALSNPTPTNSNSAACFFLGGFIRLRYFIAYIHLLYFLNFHLKQTVHEKHFTFMAS